MLDYCGIMLCMKGKLLRDADGHSKGIVHQWFTDELLIQRLDIWFGINLYAGVLFGWQIMLRLNLSLPTVYLTRVLLQEFHKPVAYKIRSLKKAVKK